MLSTNQSTPPKGGREYSYSLLKNSTECQLPPTPPSSGGKSASTTTKTSISLLMSPGTGINNVKSTISMTDNGLRNIRTIYDDEQREKDAGSVIQVMCDLPVQQAFLSGPNADDLSDTVRSRNENDNVTFNCLNSVTKVSDNMCELKGAVAMQTLAVPVVLTSPGTPDGNLREHHGQACSSRTPNITEKMSQLVKIKGNRIGRPRKSDVEVMQAEGESSSSEMKCLVCKRVFPRVKSLEAHMRIHTGEKPYQCDFPHCDRSFNQSGQLRTHHRLHTGEKPFKCGEKSCMNRYAHANRACSNHPASILKRHPIDQIETDVDSFPNKDEVAKWFYRYGRDHKIKVDILRYDNPAVEAEVKAELAVLRKTDLDIRYEQQAVLPTSSERNEDRAVLGSSAKRRKTGKDSEIQGALALMQLARH